MSVITDVLDLQALFLIVVMLLALRAFTRMVHDDNPIEMWHFFSSTRDGKQYGDPNKVGIMVGIFASTLYVGYTFWAHPIDNWYVVAVFGTWLIFIAGVESFSKWAKTFVDRRFGSDDKKTPGVAP